jgi:hypothetical protein
MMEHVHNAKLELSQCKDIAFLILLLKILLVLLVERDSINLMGCAKILE